MNKETAAPTMLDLFNEKKKLQDERAALIRNRIWELENLPA